MLSVVNMETKNNNMDTLNLLMEPETIGEAITDYLHKMELLAAERTVVSYSIPIAVDEDGYVPIIAELQPLSETRAN